MSNNGNGIPKPEPVWIALGIVVAALATALGAQRRRVFFDALRTMVEQHENRSNVAVFGSLRFNGRNMSQAIRGGVAWLKRLIVELDDGEGR